MWQFVTSDSTFGHSLVSHTTVRLLAWSERDHFFHWLREAREEDTSFLISVLQFYNPALISVLLTDAAEKVTLSFLSKYLWNNTSVAGFNKLSKSLQYTVLCNKSYFCPVMGEFTDKYRSVEWVAVSVKLYSFFIIIIFLKLVMMSWWC